MILEMSKRYLPDHYLGHSFHLASTCFIDSLIERLPSKLIGIVNELYHIFRSNYNDRS